MTRAEFRGLNGRAVQLEVDPALPGAQTTLAWWLLEGSWHPLWSQFSLSVVTLEEREDMPPAKLQFPGATHELGVLALNPGEPPRRHAPETLETGGFRAVGGYLQPADVVHQFEATDEEMRKVAELCARACTTGLLNPSTDDARERLREGWLQACVKTLAHIRGEEHAR